MRTALALLMLALRFVAALAAEAAVFARAPRVLALTALLATGTLAAKVGHVGPFASAHLQNTTVSCATTVTEIKPSANTVSMYIANSSATCISLGGTTVTTSTGMSLGSGCRDGIGTSIAFNAATCISRGGGSVTVDVVYEDY